MDEFNLTAFENVSTPSNDESSVPIKEEANVISMTFNERQNLLTQLQESFNQASELTSVLMEANMITDPYDLQEIYTENTIDESISQIILESYEDGPIFERVDREDKNKVKSIVRKIRPKIEEALKNQDVSFYKTNIIARVLLSAAGLAGGIALGGIAGKAIGAGAAKIAGGAIATKAIPIAGKAVGGAIAKGAGAKLATGAAAGIAGAATSKHGFKGLKSAVQQTFATHAWQIIGVVHIEEGNIESLCNSLTDQYSDILGDYKIIHLKAISTIYDAFKTHFGWKDQRKAFFLLVDEKLPSDLRKVSAKNDDNESEYTDVVNK